MDRHGDKTSLTILSSDALCHLLARRDDRAGPCNHCLHAASKSMFVARREELGKIERQQVMNEENGYDVGPMTQPPKETMMFKGVLRDVEIDRIARNRRADAIERPICTLRNEASSPGSLPKLRRPRACRRDALIE